jgi:hypothetical protein
MATVSFVSIVRVPALAQLDCRLELPEKITVSPITWVHPLPLPHAQARTLQARRLGEVFSAAGSQPAILGGD